MRESDPGLANARTPDMRAVRVRDTAALGEAAAAADAPSSPPSKYRWELPVPERDLPAPAPEPEDTALAMLPLWPYALGTKLVRAAATLLRRL